MVVRFDELRWFYYVLDHDLDYAFPAASWVHDKAAAI